MARSIRINITIDREARRQNTSRSAFIRTAVRIQAERRKQRAGDDEQRQRRQRAIEGMERLAHHFGDWPAEDILGEFRNHAQNLLDWNLICR